MEFYFFHPYFLHSLLYSFGYFDHKESKVGTGIGSSLAKQFKLLLNNGDNAFGHARDRNLKRQFLRSLTSWHCFMATCNWNWNWRDNVQFLIILLAWQISAHNRNSNFSYLKPCSWWARMRDRRGIVREDNSAESRTTGNKFVSKHGN